MRVTVLRLTNEPDSAGDIINRDTEIQFTKDVVVTMGFDNNRPVGFANIKRLKTKLVADIKFFDHVTVKKSSKIKLYPAIGGTIIEANDNCSATKKILLVAKKRELKKITINQIALSNSKNADKKIEPVNISIEGVYDYSKKPKGD